MRLYVDGGLIGNNPSAYGGTFAWTFVENDLQVLSGTGYVFPAPLRLPSIENNVSEYAAMLHGLEAVKNAYPEWSGVVYSDSANTIGRFKSDMSAYGIPIPFLQRKAKLGGLIQRCQFVLLQGHPTQDQLAFGQGSNGAPVSKWNVWCDDACRIMARAYRENREVSGAISANV